MTSTTQSLASAFLGGLAGYLDAQNGQSPIVTEPTPSTAYGPAGYPTAPATPPTVAAAQAPSWLWMLGLGVLAVVMMRR